MLATNGLHQQYRMLVSCREFFKHFASTAYVVWGGVVGYLGNFNYKKTGSARINVLRCVGVTMFGVQKP
jgi:hypothetical protein